MEPAGGAGCAGDGRLLRPRPRFLPRPGTRGLPGRRRRAPRRRLRSLCDEINASAAAVASQTLAVAVELDVAPGGCAVEAAVQRAWDAFGRIDVLINNAGVRGNPFAICGAICLLICSYLTGLILSPIAEY